MNVMRWIACATLAAGASQEVQEPQGAGKITFEQRRAHTRVPSPAQDRRLRLLHCQRRPRRAVRQHGRGSHERGARRVGPRMDRSHGRSSRNRSRAPSGSRRARSTTSRRWSRRAREGTISRWAGRPPEAALVLALGVAGQSDRAAAVGEAQRRRPIPLGEACGQLRHSGEIDACAGRARAGVEAGHCGVGVGAA